MRGCRLGGEEEALCFSELLAMALLNSCCCAISCDNDFKARTCINPSAPASVLG